MDASPAAPDIAAPTGPARRPAANPPALAATLRGHLPGAGAGLCLAAAQLIGRHLRFDAADPHWPDRDRVVAAPALAPLAAAIGRLTGSPALICTAFQAIGRGVGLALAERMLAGRFGRSLVDHRSWVFCEGSTLASGAAQEAAWLAGAWRLGRLAVLAEHASPGTPGLAGFAAAGWTIRHVGAADHAQITAALSAALRSLKPTLIACSGAPPAADEQAGAQEAWLATGSRLAGIRRIWLKRLARHAGRAEFDAALANRLPPRWHAPLSEPGPLLPHGATAISTAQAVRAVLATVAAASGVLPLLPGHPDWPLPAGQTDPPATQAAGGLALGMGAVLCGAAQHGGFVPLCVQPGCAADSLIPGLREAASAGARLVLLLADAGGGEAAMLHRLPNLAVFHPADAAEALECLELAIRRAAGPSVLLLSQRAVPLLGERPSRIHATRGGYLAREPAGARAVTLVASGEDLHTALQAAAMLDQAGLPAAVVSLPCRDLFAHQDAAWRRHVMGEVACIALASWDASEGALHGGVGPIGLAVQARDPRAVAGQVIGHLRRSESVWTGPPGV